MQELEHLQLFRLKRRFFKQYSLCKVLRKLEVTRRKKAFYLNEVSDLRLKRFLQNSLLPSKGNPPFSVHHSYLRAWLWLIIEALSMYGEGSVQTVGARTYDLWDLIFRRCAFPFTKLARFRTDYPVFLYQNHVNITTG